MDSIRKFRKHVVNNGSKVHHLARIDSYAFDKYKKARDAFMPIHTNDLKRWAIECYMENKVNDSFSFKASDKWIVSFKKRHRIVSRKAIKIVCQKQVQNFEELQKSIDDFRDLFKEKIPQYEEK